MDVFRKANYSSGVSLVELLVVMGIIAILSSIGGLSFAGMRMKSQLNLVAAEIRGELLRARARSANSISAGVYFDTDRFVYYEDDAYVEGASGNVETELPKVLIISQNTLENHTAVFDPLTGRLTTFNDPSQITITDTQSGVNRTIFVNQWGLIDIN